MVIVIVLGVNGRLLCHFRHEDASLLLAVLRSLASVRRFDMAVMFMSPTEKKSTHTHTH